MLYFMVNVKCFFIAKFIKSFFYYLVCSRLPWLPLGTVQHLEHVLLKARLLKHGATDFSGKLLIFSLLF